MPPKAAAICAILGSRLLVQCLAFQLPASQGIITSRQHNSTSGVPTLTEFDPRANATGSWPVTGFDVSRPFGAAAGNSTWMINIVTAAGLTQPGSETGSNPSRLTLQPPQNAFENSRLAPGWSVCSHVWYTDNWITQDKAKKIKGDVNGTCTPVISSDCLSAIVSSDKSSKGPCESRVWLGPDACPWKGSMTETSKWLSATTTAKFITSPHHMA
jgi:hypothetical protein